MDKVDQIYSEIVDTAAWHLSKKAPEYESAIFASAAHIVEELRKIRELLEDKAGADDHNKGVE